MSTPKLKQLLVDIHTHCYLPRYAAFLRSRSNVPKIFSSGVHERLLILDDEPSTGRPVGPQVRLYPSGTFCISPCSLVLG